MTGSASQGRSLKQIRALHEIHKALEQTRPWTQAEISVQDVDYLLAKIEALKAEAKRGA